MNSAVESPRLLEPLMRVRPRLAWVSLVPLATAIVCTLGFAGLWLVSSTTRPRQSTVIIGQYTCHLALEPSRVSITAFRDIAEDEFYRHWNVPLWMPTFSTLALTGGLATWHNRRRNHRAIPGFPL